MSLMIVPNVCFGQAMITVKNFCNQAVTLHASDDIECEPSGIEIDKKRDIHILEVNSGSVEVCYPTIDNGQSTYYMQIEQQDTSIAPSPEIVGLQEDGNIVWYCSNSGPTGPCGCVAED